MISIHQVQQMSDAEVVRADNDGIVGAQLAECERLLCQAEVWLDAGQPDRAALLLDGLAQAIAAAWLSERQLPAPAPDVLLASVEEHAPLLGWHLRLALRAPNVEARLVHCQQLLHDARGL